MNISYLTDFFVIIIQTSEHLVKKGFALIDQIGSIVTNYFKLSDPPIEVTAGSLGMAIAVRNMSESAEVTLDAGFVTVVVRPEEIATGFTTVQVGDIKCSTSQLMGSTNRHTAALLILIDIHIIICSRKS